VAVFCVFAPLRARDPFSNFEEAPGEAGEPLWGEHPLFGVDPEATPRARSGDSLDEAATREFAGGDGDRRRVEALLGPTPISIDDLARAAELDVKTIRQAIVELDLAGRIEYCGGNRVALLGADGESSAR
jgi:DNA processing protein